jgi:hypothetical protein
MERYSLEALRRLRKDGKTQFGWIRYCTPTSRVSLNDETKVVTVESRDMKTGNWLLVEQYEAK